MERTSKCKGPEAYMNVIGKSKVVLQAITEREGKSNGLEVDALYRKQVRPDPTGCT